MRWPSGSLSWASCIEVFAPFLGFWVETVKDLYFNYTTNSVVPQSLSLGLTPSSALKLNPSDFLHARYNKTAEKEPVLSIEESGAIHEDKI